MYSVTFERDDGKRFLFDARNDIVFDMNLGDGLDIDVKTSQGFSQVGETIEGKGISGKIITCNGVIFKNITEGKNRLRDMFRPMTKGRLLFGGKYYMDVVVKKTPYFSTVKKNGRFTLDFYAPFPFFCQIEGESVLTGGMEKEFRFPVNYVGVHRFGTRVSSRFIKVYNEGDIEIPFHLHLECNGGSTNPTLSNIETFEFLKINGQLFDGDILDVYTKDNMLKAEIIRDGVVEDVLHWIDEDSTLFGLKVGDNLLVVNDDEGLLSLIGRISFNPAVVNVYET